MTESETLWRCEDVLEELYLEQGMTQQEIAEELGCSQKTVSDWLSRHGIDTGCDAKQRSIHPTFTTRERSDRVGSQYIYVRCRSSPSGGIVAVHQLIAIANGEDPSKVFSSEYDVHHKTGHGLDNRHGNIILLTKSEHITNHHNR